jgi:hypothetical protein
MVAYEKGKPGRKPFLTAEQKYDRKREWERNNPENVFGYRRTEVLKRCMERGGFPKLSTVQKYNITEEELREIADAWGIDISFSDED